MGYCSPNITFTSCKCSKNVTFTPPIYVIFVNRHDFNYKRIKNVDKIGILLGKMDNKSDDVGKITLQKKA